MINIAGVVSISLFYALILGVGIWAGRKKEEGNDSEEEVMLAGRSIGLFVGIFTMTGKNLRKFYFINKLFPKSTLLEFRIPKTWEIFNVTFLFFSNVGRRRLHQRNGRSHLYLRAGVVSGSIWLCIEFSLR